MGKAFLAMATTGGFVKALSNKEAERCWALASQIDGAEIKTETFDGIVVHTLIDRVLGLLVYYAPAQGKT